MKGHFSPRLNFLLGGYSARWVFSAGGGGDPEKFSPAAKKLALGSMAGLASGIVAGASDSATFFAPAEPAGSPRMAVFRRFRGGVRVAVDGWVVDGSVKVAVFQGVRLAGRLIANYRDILTDGMGGDRGNRRKCEGGPPPFARKCKISPVAHMPRHLRKKFSMGRISACHLLDSHPEGDKIGFGSNGVGGRGKNVTRREDAPSIADLRLWLADSGPSGSGTVDCWGIYPKRTAQAQLVAWDGCHVNAT